jgi:ABC-2 type transport system ATP-binding protein
MLQAQNLTKQYGTHTALLNLNIEVAAGEIYCMLGANGAGKTTTINLFLGFTKPSAGKAIINKLEVDQDPHTARQFLAYIPEQVTLYPSLTGIENLSYFSALARQNYTTSALEELLLRSGLQAEAFNKPVGKYSKGMRQKVGIAIALAKKAKVLLLDEPTSGLDPYASHEFSKLIQELSKDGMAILMATHDLFRAKEDATTIGIMSNGRLKKEMKAADYSLHEVEAAYLSIINNALSEV